MREELIVERVFLRTDEAAEYLAISRALLFRLAAAGKIRRTRHAARTVRWEKAELDRYVREGTGRVKGRQR